MGDSKLKQKRSKKIKEFDELTITDDFMFGAVMSDPARCKPLLEYILGIKIARIEYAEKQKTIDLSYDAKGVRLDLNVIDDKGIIYNVEIQNTKIEFLPKRIRYYHDVLDLNLLKKSKDYSQLNKCYVIFICTFDFFGKERYMYTFKKQCQEDSTVFLNDDEVSIILNTNGKYGDINDELKDTLHYMAGQKPTGKFAKELDAAVQEIKRSDDWRVDYMTYAMNIREHELAAHRYAKKLGNLEKSVSAIRVLRNNLNSDLLMASFHIDKPTLDNILEMIDNYPDWTDEDIAADIIGE